MSDERRWSMQGLPGKVADTTASDWRPILMSKAILFFASLLILSTANAALDAKKPIYCRFIQEDGISVATIELKKNGNYVVNDVDAGENFSQDSSTLEVDSRPWLPVFCSGAMAVINLETGEGEISYKYDSGFLGGGCQKRVGIVRECNHEAWPQD